MLSFCALVNYAVVTANAMVALRSFTNCQRSTPGQHGRAGAASGLRQQEQDPCFVLCEMARMLLNSYLSFILNALLVICVAQSCWASLLLWCGWSRALLITTAFQKFRRQNIALQSFNGSIESTASEFLASIFFWDVGLFSRLLISPIEYIIAMTWITFSFVERMKCLLFLLFVTSTSALSKVRT